MGEAASLLALKIVPSEKTNMDVCLASLRGSERLTNEEWNTEFTRVQSAMKQSSSSSSTELFTTEFGSVPDNSRLADWLATKWAPAILRTYEIAGIRVGARPVYASRLNENLVEIVWQQLVDFNPKTVGKIQIEISEDGTSLLARRVAGNTSQGYGRVSLKPLAGEDVIVRSLADAAAQAVEKGLAIKPTKVKTEKPTKTAATSVAQPMSTVASSGTVAASEPVSTTTVAPSLESGPRSAGAKRSSVRSRGKRKTRSSDSTNKNDKSNPTEGSFE